MHASNYGNCETVSSFEVLTIDTKNIILHVTGFLENIDLSFNICVA